MRLSLSLVLIVVLESLAALGAWQVSQRAWPKMQEFQARVKLLSQKLDEASQWSPNLDIGEIYGKNFGQLSDEALSLPHTFAFDTAMLRAAMDCHTRKIIPTELAKEAAWQKFRCGEKTAFSEAMLREPPFVNPFGHSYVQLAEQAGLIPAPTAENGWFSFVPLAELKSWHPKEHVFAYLSTVEDIKALHQRQPVILGDAIVVLNENFLVPDTKWGLRYRFLDRASWDRVTNELQLIVAPRNDERCPAEMGQLCLRRNPQQRNLWRGVSLLFLILSGVTAVMGAGTIWWIRRKRWRADYQIRQQTINLLTHELRTPVAGMRITLENMRSHFDGMQDSVQSDFLALCTEMQRLTRTLEASEHYVRSSQDARMHVPTRVNVTAFLRSLSETVTGPDATIEVYVPWLRIAVENIVRNAVSHGRGPVRIDVVRDGRFVNIHIVDQGELAQNPLRQRVASDDRGLGVGLVLTQELLRRMGSTLSCTFRPTTFTLRFEAHESH